MSLKPHVQPSRVTCAREKCACACGEVFSVQLGGRCEDRLYRMDRADPVDVASAFFTTPFWLPETDFVAELKGLNVKMGYFVDWMEGCHEMDQWDASFLSNPRPPGFLPTSMVSSRGLWMLSLRWGRLSSSRKWFEVESIFRLQA